MKFLHLLLLMAIGQIARANDAHVFNTETISENKIAWSCEGQGAPTIVLMAGLGLDVHSSFDLVYHQYKGRGTICMYDRPGMGQSSFKIKGLRRLTDLVEELHQLKEKRGWQNLVLVPHSFAGFIARAYVSKYPGDVKGVVFLDVTHEDWMPRLEQKMAKSDFAIMRKVIDWSSASFYEDYLEAQEATRKSVYPNSLPSTVISRGIPTTKTRRSQMSYAGIDVFNAEHDKLQKEIAALSKNSKHIVAKVAAHEINSYDPWLVIDEIKALVETLAE